MLTVVDKHADAPSDATATEQSQDVRFELRQRTTRTKEWSGESGTGFVPAMHGNGTGNHMLGNFCSRFSNHMSSRFSTSLTMCPLSSYD